MKNKKNIFNKEAFKKLLVLVLGVLLSSTLAYAADNYLFEGEKVSYDNTTSGLNAGNVQSALDELYVESTSYQLFEQRVSTIENKIYPVGSIYLSLTDDTVAKVQARMGGTWEKIGQGRTLIGAGTNDGYTFTVGGTQSTVAGNSSSSSQTIANPLGEYTHKLSIDEMPKHYHDLAIYSALAGMSGEPCMGYGNIGNTMTSSVGSDYYHNNIQQYLVVYMYKRTA